MTNNDCKETRTPNKLIYMAAYISYHTEMYQQKLQMEIYYEEALC